MLNLQELKNEIEKQIRNGREDVYLKVSDLNDLGYETHTVAERIFVKKNEVLLLIAEAEKKAFKENLKVTTSTYSNVNNNNKDYNFEVIDREI